ncbi:hypothetical protein EKK58_12840 [Candidatus Dependentiae bacterium]|nr:MAG: hypothetical protein EKK58_12840 [Candidatus Dependentiae bacterium]
MKNLAVNDCEVYPNYFLAAFKDLDTGKIISVEINDEDEALDEKSRKILNSMMIGRIVFGFNNHNYDIPIITAALAGKTLKEINEISNFIIKGNSYHYMTMKKYKLFKPKQMRYFDIAEPSPGVMVSLKLYGARMHSKRLQDLPIEAGTYLTDEQKKITKLYCFNDLDTTIDLYRNIEDRMKLRFELAEDYGDAVLSKSDAQIAEIVIKSELGLENFKKQKLPKDKTYKYNVPDFISFESDVLNETLDIIKKSNFELDARGSIKLPKQLSNMKIKLGHSVYKLGVGGIHTQESQQTIIPDKNQLLVDRDVAAYYPNIILLLKLFPRHLGVLFLKVYKRLVKRRLEAKKKNRKVEDASLKIVINGIFGKLGNKYSIIYSPDLLLAVTLTGQLSLLMLIERLEDAGISVVSANTDGFVSLLPKSKYELYDDICFNWELETGFDLEEIQYKALYSRDVNNYMAVTKDNQIKGKGIFQPVNTIKKQPSDVLGKNPQAEICVIAAKEYLVNNTPPILTIKKCKDVTKFLTARSVTGGAEWKDEYLGRVVRWIYSTDGEAILYKKNANKVAKSDNARPIMELGEFPDDLDYKRYAAEAEEIIFNLGLGEL